MNTRPPIVFNRPTRELAADVVMTLIHDKVLGNGPDTLTMIERSLGLTKIDLLHAMARIAPDHYELTLTGRPPSAPPQPTATPAATPAPQRRRRRNPEPKPADSTREPTRQRERREIEGVPHLYCAGYKDRVTDRAHAPHWASEDEFLVRADRPHLRTHLCHDGRKLYQVAHRVSTKALEDISAAGFELVLDAKSNLVGIKCKACGEPFEPGQKVEGEAAMRHVDCGHGHA